MVRKSCAGGVEDSSYSLAINSNQEELKRNKTVRAGKWWARCSQGKGSNRDSDGGWRSCWRGRKEVKPMIKMVTERGEAEGDHQNKKCSKGRWMVMQLRSRPREEMAMLRWWWWRSRETREGDDGAQSRGRERQRQEDGLTAWRKRRNGEVS